jgi:hypothetical protein
MSKVVAGKRPVNHFTMIPNNLIRNKAISDSTFRLICWVSSHQEGFEISFASIKSQLGYGRDKLRSILKEAEESNYLVRNRTNGNGGLFDWEYHIFLDPNDAIAYRETIGGKPVDGEDNHRGVNRSMVEPPTVEPHYGDDPPHNKKQYREDQTKKDQPEKKTPPTPSYKSADVEVMDLPSPNNSALAILEPEIKAQVQSPFMVATVRPQSNSIRQIFEETGNIPHYGTEYKLWIQEEMGDVIAHYRKSGQALNRNPNDIHLDFRTHVAVRANNGKGLSMGAVEKWILNCEKDPDRWPELRAMVSEWIMATATGDRSINVAKEIDRASKPVIELNFNQF